MAANLSKTVFQIIAPVVIFSGVSFADVDFDVHTVDDDAGRCGSIFAVDLDDDGDVDLVGSDSRRDMIYWWENDGDQGFSRHPVADEFDGAIDVHPIDVNDDGEMDIVAAAHNLERVVWWENEGDEDFTSHLIAENFYGVRIHAVDLDDDGDVDVLGTEHRTHEVVWWENDGADQFIRHLIADDFLEAWDVKTGDIDGDDDIDIVATAFDADVVAWWENDGAERFTPHVVSDEVDGARDVHVIDLDRDGDTDVLVAALNSDEILWLDNDGEQEFTRRVIGADFESARSVSTADLDNDGDLDVIGVSFGDDMIAWWENDGEQNFTQHVLDEGFDGALVISISDLDSDGDADVIGAAYNAEEIRWYENQSPRFSLTVSRDSMDFGLVAVEDSVSIGIDVSQDMEAEGAEDLDLDIAVVEGRRWLSVEPESAELLVGESIRIELTVFLSEGDALGPKTGLIVITPNELAGMTVDIAVEVTAVAGFGSIVGTVTDSTDGEPMQLVDVHLVGSQTTETTDERGEFYFDDLPAGTYRLSVGVDDYLPYLSNDLAILPDQELVCDISMLHALCNPDRRQIDLETTPDTVENVLISIRNDGNGPLDFSIAKRFPLGGGGDWDRWDRIFRIDAAELCGDDRLQGVAFDGENFYVTGGDNGDGLGKVFVFSPAGEYIRSFDQFRESRWGIRDLTWDGELLWGGDEGTVFGFTTDGELRAQFQGPLDNNRSIAWDERNGLFWICDVSSDLFGVDSRGNVIERLTIEGDLHIYGLDVYINDPDGFYLHSFCKDGIYDTQVNRLDRESMSWVHVRNVVTQDEHKAGGMCITGLWNPLAFVCAGVLQGRDDVPDELSIWIIGTRSVWLDVDVEDGTALPGSDMVITVTFDSNGLSAGTEAEGELIISHNGRGDSVEIPLRMSVVDVRFVQGDPAPGLPGSFSLDQPYPNPFNSETRIAFSLPVSTEITLSIVDLSGRVVESLCNQRMAAGFHTVAWKAESFPTGVYLVILNTNGFRAVRKVTVLR